MSISKVLIIGLGSIGRRHAQIIHDNYPDIQIIAYRSNPSSKIVFEYIEDFYDFEGIFDNNKVDIAFICNPTNLHVKYAIECAKRGISLFIEKPLSNSLKNLDELRTIIQEKELLVHIGYDMRYHPILKKIKVLIDKEENKPFYAKATCSSYLPSWRKNQDYKDSYSSKLTLGGGVILDISHEIDYINWLSNIEELSGNFGKISSLEIDTEDFADINFSTQKFKGTIHLDYFSHLTERKLQLFYDHKYIECDFINNTIKIIENQKTNIENFDIDYNQVYRDQIADFFINFNNQEFNKDTINNAIKLLSKIIDMKEKENQTLRENT